LLDIPRLRSGRDRSVAPVAWCFWFLFGGFLSKVTGLADSILPRSGIIKGPEGL
jgi:hypothetical protein